MLNQVNLVATKPLIKKEQPVEAILEATDKLFSSEGDANEMINQATLLANATTKLIGEIKEEADSERDNAAKNRLLDAARELADNTSRLGKKIIQIIN
jgi:predicted transcriptional regulator